MTEPIAIDLLDENGEAHTQFIDAESASTARKRAVTRAWTNGVIAGAFGASMAYIVTDWLTDGE